MMKYSIIIPVYNTSKYLKKCLDSIINQTYKDYEVIIINDGSTDNSLDIIKEYSSKNKSIKYKSIKNSGLSVARNTGVSLARGEYILFLDSDDYIDKNLLNKLSIYDNDVIRFQVREVLDNDSIIKEYNEHAFKNYNTYDALNIIVNYHFVENAWAYAYKKEFYIKNKFSFMSGIYHEDYALIPLVLCKAKTISSIDYIGYNYVQRSNSIMSSKDYEKIKKKVYDFLKAYDHEFNQHADYIRILNHKRQFDAKTGIIMPIKKKR